MANSQENHIENFRLIRAAEGESRLEESDLDHLHRCEECQSTFLVFIQQYAAQFPQINLQQINLQGEVTDKIAAGVDSKSQRR